MVLNPSAALPLNLEITYVALRKKDRNQKLKKNMPKRLCIELLPLLLLFQCFLFREDYCNDPPQNKNRQDVPK
jgi:hypothetical protein